MDDQGGSLLVEGLPTWATDPPEPATPPRTARHTVGRRAIGAGLVALLLVALGHRLGAAVLVGVMLATSVLSLAVPQVDRAIDAAIRGFQRLVGGLLTTVLLGLVHVVVFVPVALVLRLVRLDPLALGSSAADPTFWRKAARRPGRPLYRRPFTDERHPPPVTTTGRGHLRRVRPALTVVALFMVLDLVAGTLVGHEPRQTRPRPGTMSLVVPDIAAAEDEPWAETLFAEITNSYQSLQYHPYRGWFVNGREGRYFDVEFGRRTTYAYEMETEAEPLDVWFFGGSAMMGWFQRDEHTIASEIVRLAEDDGIPVRAVNLAQPGYSMWQELLLFEELLIRAEADDDYPDLVVFYDGANELLSQFSVQRPSSAPVNLYGLDTARRLRADADGRSRPDVRAAVERLVDEYTSRSAVGELVHRLGRDEENEFDIPWKWDDQPVARGHAAADLYNEGVELVDMLAAEAEVPTAFFWQPWIYSKTVVEGEEEAVGSWATDPDAYTTAGRIARGNLDDAVVDLSTVFRGEDDPVMYDFVHTNEHGARIVAEAMYDEIGPTLEEAFDAAEAERRRQEREEGGDP